MRRKGKDIYIVYILCYLISMLFSYTEQYFMSGLTLAIAAVGLYLHEYFRTGNPIGLKGLFSLFWIGGQALSCLKLSSLQARWSIWTWLCFFLAYLCFCFGYSVIESRTGSDRLPGNGRKRELHIDEKRLFLGIIIITLISSICFSLEAVILGFVPILSDKPHAYSYFHISGVHYFTVMCVLVPSLSVIYFKCCRRISTGHFVSVLLASGISFLIPILCVSRFQLIAMLLLAVVTYLSMRDRLKLHQILACGLVFVVLMIPVYLILTRARNHDVEYLNGIFEMKNRATPIFITQPYMYIANNYDNFNAMVEQLQNHTFGLKMLFPLWAFTGLKFIFPQLVTFPLFTTKEELTTVTLFYDAYYDFGVVGIIIFALLLGGICAWVYSLAKDSRNPVAHLFYAQTAIYLTLSFFTTWLSNPTTWFWLVITGIVYFLTAR